MAAIDTLISVLSSFVVFSYLGALASRMNVPVTKVVEEGTLHLFYTFTVLRLYQKRQICRSCAFMTASNLRATRRLIRTVSPEIGKMDLVF